MTVRRWGLGLLLLLVALLAWGVGRWRAAPAPVARRSLAPRQVGRLSDHTELFAKAGISRYEGSKSCVECHEGEVQEVFNSIHYQMAGPVDDVEGRETVRHGGRYAYNDFCGAIFWQGKGPVNFIGKAVLKVAPPGQEEKVGTFIASGCSMCHGTSMGLVPQEEPTPEQLGNIDCLACHSDLYLSGPKGVKSGQKVPVQGEDGTWRYEVTVDLKELAPRIVEVPTKENCLGCHAFSGGGPGFKRPNLSPALMGEEVPEEIDVHLARGLHCVDCHPGEGHRFPTKTPDTWSREAGQAPTCSDCHQEVHRTAALGWVLNTFHLERVACQTCHIPRFAKVFPTDVKRDWSQAVFVEEGAKWEPKIDFEKEVAPVYRWWNERTRQAYLYPEKAPLTDGDRILYLAPVGGPVRRSGLLGWEADGKIYPFKRHEAVVPFDREAGLPVPIKVGVVFATGDARKGAELGAKAAGLTFTGEYVTLERYMAVNHGVEPADRALGCLDCHGLTEKRLPWHALGYGHYPEIAFATALILVVGILVGGGALAYRRLR